MRLSLAAWADAIDHELLLGPSATNFRAASIVGKVRECRPWAAQRLATSCTVSLPNPVSAITNEIRLRPASRARGSHLSLIQSWSACTMTLTFLESLTYAVAW